MKKVLVTIFSSIMLFGLAGCANLSNQDAGVLAGGAIGGAMGSLFGHGSGKILSAVAGTAIGAFIGGRIGHSMDQADQMRMSQAMETAPSDRIVSWQNPDTGDQYYVRPTHTYYRGDQPCRDFTTKAIIGGKKETIYGRACRKADGTWKVIQ